MVYHHPTESDVDWSGLQRATFYVASRLRAWGGIYIYEYEVKDGTVRVSIAFCNNKWPCFFEKLQLSYQEWVYRLVYWRAMRLWPHLRDEILLSADHRYLMEPGVWQLTVSIANFAITLVDSIHVLGVKSIKLLRRLVKWNAK